MRNQDTWNQRRWFLVSVLILIAICLLLGGNKNTLTFSINFWTCTPRSHQTTGEQDGPNAEQQPADEKGQDIKSGTANREIDAIIATWIREILKSQRSQKRPHPKGKATKRRPCNCG